MAVLFMTCSLCIIDNYLISQLILQDCINLDKYFMMFFY